MTPQLFKHGWTDAKHPLSPLTSSRLDRFNLSKSSVDFLTVAGLPEYAEPSLFFANDKDDIVLGINKLTEQYDFIDDKDDYEKYVVIGGCRDGDAIAINTDLNDQIEQLDHEDSFSSKFFNSSINLLADFLILYRDFEKAVLADKDPDKRMEIFNFTDNQFDTLKEIMLHVDERAVNEDGFWKDELEMMLSIRHQHFGVSS